MNFLKNSVVSAFKLPYTSRYLRRRARPSASISPNPGLDNVYKSFEREGISINDNLEEYYEDSEIDISNMGASYRDYEKEKSQMADKVRYQIIKQKYFKENLPNLLTWSEKEQIRYLNAENPEEWTPERIAESFPVTAEVVKKLIKYPWKPASSDRIKRHDNSALRNWKLLLNNELKLPEDLKKHVMKFSNRDLTPVENAHSDKIVFEAKKPIGEFQSIVMENIQNEDNFNQSKDSINCSETNSSEKPKVGKPNPKITLDELKLSISKKVKSGEDIDMSDKIMSENIDLENNSKQETILTEDTKNEILHSEIIPMEAKTDVHLPDYPERIRIPKKLLVRGATYRVKDCYYDYDGRFLYRVPGMDM